MKALVAVLVGLLVVAVAVVAAIRLSSKLPEGPVEPVWDREACAHCRMHLGEPAFAAQLQTAEGDVLYFDDPGCLMTYVDKHHPQAHGIYFHHMERKDWVSSERVGFISVERSPMGYGFGAVEAGTPGAISFEEAARRALQPIDAPADAAEGEGHGPMAH